jgi:YbbR domain-containing protein
VLRRSLPQWRRAATPLALGTVSLIAALALWIAVTGAENPTRVAVFRGAIEVEAVNVPEGLAVFSIENPVVSLRISAAEDTFDKLTTADFKAQVDMAGVRDATTDQVVIAKVVGGRDVEIVEVSPAFVTVTLQSEVTKQVPVVAHRIGSPLVGYSVTRVETNPNAVRVRGAAGLVDLVDSATADVNLTGFGASLQQQYTLTPRDRRGADIRNVRLEPAAADVRITIVQEEVTLSLLVSPLLQGSVAEGYNLVSVTTDPPAVGVSGPLAVLQALSFVTTEAIDVSGLRSDLARSVRLRLPAGLQASRDSVSVTLRVQPARGEIALSVAPRVSGVGEGLQAALQTSSVNLRLRGDLPTLRGLSPASVTATVNASGLDVGIHVLNVTVSVPPNVEVASVDPTSVVVVLSR